MRLGGIAVVLPIHLAIVGTVLRSLAEVTPFANGRGVANLAYWVTDTEGSNPSLSATQSVGLLTIGDSRKLARGRADSLSRGSGESDQSCKLPIRHDSSLFEEIRCHERILSDRDPKRLRSWIDGRKVVRSEEARLSNPQGVAAGRPIRSEHRSGSSDAPRRGRRLAALHRWIPRLLEREVRAAPDGAHSYR